MQEIAVEFVYAIKTRRRFNSLAKSTFRVSTRFTSLLFAVRTSTVAIASTEVTTFTSTHNLPLSSLLSKVLYFLLSRVNKLDRDFLHCQLLSFVWPLRNHVTMRFSHQSFSACKDGDCCEKGLLYCSRVTYCTPCKGTRNPEWRKILQWNPKYSARNPESHLFIPLLNSRRVDHLNQLQVVQHWRLFHSKVVWDKCVKSVGRIKNGIRASTI